MDLETRLTERGQALAAREAKHADALGRARAFAETLHERVSRGLAAYHAEVAAAPWLGVELGSVTTDAKHLHAFEFDVRRGRHRAIVVVKSRGDVTLVGPFHMGKDEGPCRRIAFGSEGTPTVSNELQTGLAELLEAFLDEATCA